MRFAYVKSEREKERLEELGFRLLKADERNEVWVFDWQSGPDTATFGEIGARIFFSDSIAL